MKFRIDHLDDRQPSIKIISLLPSEEQGGFIVDHPHYGGVIAVGRITLGQVSPDVMSGIESGATPITALFQNGDGRMRPNHGIYPVAEMPIPDSSITVTVDVAEFREVEVLPPTATGVND